MPSRLAGDDRAGHHPRAATRRASTRRTAGVHGRDGPGRRGRDRARERAAAYATDPPASGPAPRDADHARPARADDDQLLHRPRARRRRPALRRARPARPPRRAPARWPAAVRRRCSPRPGQAVILGPAGHGHAHLALAWGRLLRRPSPADPRLRAFADSGSAPRPRAPGGSSVQLACASRCARSTPPSATSRATRRRSAPRSRGPARPAPQLVALPRAGASPATRPRTCCSSAHFLREARADARADRRATRDGIVALVGFPERAEDVYNAAAVLADGARARRSTARSTCPTTASSTSSATSSPGRAARVDRARRRRASA